MKISEKFLVFSIFILSFVSVGDLFLRQGHPITFDGHIHMTTMNQFAQSIKSGEFPVTWSNNFANFGLPLPLFSHQLPAYLGALLIIFGFSTESAFKILILFSIVISNILFYSFYKKLSNINIAFVMTSIAIFFPYRELSIYTRGSLPEIMSTIFLPLMFLGVWNLHQRNYKRSSLLLYFSSLAISLTHPMMLLVFCLPLSIYFFTKLDKKDFLKHIFILLASLSFGILSASFYLMPLFLEMKYFFQSAIKEEMSADRFLQFKQLYDPTWLYTFTHPGPRANFIKLGLLEFSIVFTAIIFIIVYKLGLIKKIFKKENIAQISVWLTMTITALVLALPISKHIYALPFFSQIQYPWRFLNVLQFLIPGLAACLFFVIKSKHRNVFLFSLLFIVIIFRVPQFYGKNYVIQNESDYEFTKSNLHSLNMNPLWTGDSEIYETKTTQAEIIEGVGKLEIVELKNASRKYKVSAETEVRMIDFTFYFPGWVVVDAQNSQNNNISIEYQDLNYRGLITYKLPKGEHTILVEYRPTKIRMAARYLSIFGIFAYLIFFKIFLITKFKD